MNEPVVEARGLVKTYGQDEEQVSALRGVSLTVRRGEFVAIMGASGSGKSTCMHILGCLDTPTQGEYLLEGRRVDLLPKNDLAEVRNRRLGFVFQGFNLLPRTTALENVELPLVYGQVRPAARRERALHALEMVGLADRAGHLGTHLSGGQQQRVAIARALVNNPALLLADEPTGNLDSATSEEIMALFGLLHRKGTTIVMVTHEPDVAAHAGRRVVFRDGRIVRDSDGADGPQTGD